MDIDKFNLIIENSRKVYIKDLSKSFYNIMLTFFINLNSELTMNLLEDYIRFFHSVKGTSATLKFNTLSDIGKKYELLLSEKDLDSTSKSELINIISSGISYLYVEYLKERENYFSSDIIEDFNEIDHNIIPNVAEKHSSNAIINSEVNHENIDITNFDNLKILIVENTLEENSIIQKTLHKYGIYFKSLEKIHNIFDIIKSHNFNVILINPLSKELNPFEVYEQVKKLDINFHIYFYTSNFIMQETCEILNYDYICEPFDKNIMDKLISIKDTVVKVTTSVLIVDDDINILNYMKSILLEFAYKVTTLQNPLEITNILKTNIFHVIFLDVLMKGMNGYEVLKILRSANYNIPIIFITAMEMDITAFSSKFVDYIKKPFSAEDLIEKLENTLHHETKFEFTPIEIKKIEEPIQTKIESTSNTKHILVIDDEYIIGELIVNVLSDKDFKVHHVTDGFSGIDFCNNNSPDLVMIDLMLPKIDGFQVCKALKSNPKLNKTKLIVLSSKKKEEDIIRCYELGIDDYITKPFNLKELQIKVKKLLNQF